MALDDQGFVYVSFINGVVKKFDEWGAYSTFTPPDLGPGTEFVSLAVIPNRRIHVVDRGASRVLVLNQNLELIGQWDLTCAGSMVMCHRGGRRLIRVTFMGLDINALGQSVLVKDCLFGGVVRFAPSPTVPVHAMTWGKLKAFYR